MAKLIRNETPKHYSDYTNYKPFLRRDCNYSCVYCDIRESEFGGKKSFHIDHYKPKKKFPSLLTDYQNLLYACRDCNEDKGQYWPTPIEQMQLRIVLNPFRLDPEKHFDKSADEWKDKSPVGRFTRELLNVNRQSRLDKRRDRRSFQNLLKRLNDDLSKARKNQLRATAQANVSALQASNAAVLEIEDLIATCKNNLGPMLD